MILDTLRDRFATHTQRHSGVEWPEIQARLEKNPAALASLQAMEESGGEPDLLAYDPEANLFVYCDFSAETPSGRRSLCYDDKALNDRKENKPRASSLGMAAEMGVEILTEDEYRTLQHLGEFDLKTSSWIKTPDSIRALGGALFCDRRYGQVFTYHNGAESYYGARGFRAKIRF